VLAHSNKSAEGNNQYLIPFYFRNLIRFRSWGFYSDKKNLKEKDAIVVKREDMRGRAVTGCSELRGKEYEEDDAKLEL